MAKQITPLKNSKLGSNSKTLVGSSYLQVTRSGEGKECLPYVDTVDLAPSTKTTITTHTSNITTLQSDVTAIKTIQNGAENKNTKAEFIVCNVDISIASGGTQTIAATVIDVVNLSSGTGYVKPTIVTTDAALGKNNRFLVNKFMTTDHSNYIVQATYEDGAGFDYTDLQEEINIEISGCSADSFYFRMVNKKGIPLTNLRLAKMGTLKLKFEITGTKR
jgi:hypothetical protein|tara:strand:- start:3057 stop:3713 length:657 start_codon:yes stop_codon:yes gene_type:complete